MRRHRDTHADAVFTTIATGYLRYSSSDTVLPLRDFTLKSKRVISLAAGADAAAVTDRELV